MFTGGETIGIIGTGLMGAAMTVRLLAAGFRVLGWDRDLAQLAASGAEAAGSAVAVADACRGVLLSLPDSNSGRFATAAGVLLAGFLFTALGGDYARVGTLCATIYALVLVVIWFAPDTSSKHSDA